MFACNLLEQSFQNPGGGSGCPWTAGALAPVGGG